MRGGGRRAGSRFAGEVWESLSEVADVGEISVTDAGVARVFLWRVAPGGGGGTEVGLWMGVESAVSWVRCSCVQRRADTVAWKGVRSADVSLGLI